MQSIRSPARRRGSLFSPCPHCTECPEVVITDEGIAIRENANTIRLHELMRGRGVARKSQSRFRRARLAKLLSWVTLAWFGRPHIIRSPGR
jgi:hypothetical protein